MNTSRSRTRADLSVPVGHPFSTNLRAFVAAGVLLAGLLTQSAARASEIGVSRRVGLGIQGGAAPGFSAKAWVSPQNALDFGVGFGPGRFACNDNFNPCGKRMSFNIDYLVHPGRSSLSPGFLAWHIGIGARVWFYEYGSTDRAMTIAARVPIGLDLMILSFLELFGEVAPSLAFDPGRGFVEGMLGVRVYIF